MAIRAQINLRLLMFTVAFTALFITLGFWQLERAVEKTVQIAQHARLLNLPAEKLEGVPGDERLDGRLVQLVGKIEVEQVFLLDNVVLDGRVGFEVVHSMQLDQGGTVLINRGFVAAGASRAVLPSVPALADRGTASGRIYRSDWVNSDQALAYDGWPRIVPTQDPGVLSGLLARQLLPFVVRLEASDPNGLPRNWVTSVMLPEKHQGYAVQWFAMAVVLICMFLYFTFGRQTQGAPS